MNSLRYGRSRAVIMATLDHLSWVGMHAQTISALIFCHFHVCSWFSTGFLCLWEWVLVYFLFWLRVDVVSLWNGGLGLDRAGKEIIQLVRNLQPLLLLIACVKVLLRHTQIFVITMHLTLKSKRRVIGCIIWIIRNTGGGEFCFQAVKSSQYLSESFVVNACTTEAWSHQNVKGTC